MTQSSSELAYLSDFAFWDAMPLEGDAQLSAKIMTAAVPPEQSAEFLREVEVDLTAWPKKKA